MCETCAPDCSVGIMKLAPSGLWKWEVGMRGSERLMLYFISLTHGIPAM